MSTLIIPEAYKWLDVTGINVKDGIISKRAKILTVLSIIVVALELMQLGLNIRDINVVAGVIEVCAPVYLALIKIQMLTVQSDILITINKNIKAFWSLESMEIKLKNQLNHLFVCVKTMLSIYRWLAITTTTMIIPLKPILSGKGGLPIDIWQPVNLMVTPYYEIVYLLESSVGYFASFINIAVDSLYVAYIVHLICQIKMVKCYLKKISLNSLNPNVEETCWNQLKMCIEYHTHLLSVIQNIQKSHSFAFFNIFGIGTLCICIDLYSAAFNNGSLDVLRIIKYSFQCSFFVFLLFAYCFTGNELTHQCLSVSDAMYEAEWYYNPSPRIRKAIVLTIQRTQKLEQLNAGGLVTLDLENFIKMLRLAFSVFTLIRTQVEKESL